MSLNDDQTAVPHRLPTKSASEALQDVKSDASKTISLGIQALDRLFSCSDASSQNTMETTGGLLRGHVTEIYGPPGSGKTTIALQAAATALHVGGKVIWADAAGRIPGNRLKPILNKLHKDKISQTDNDLQESSIEEDLARLYHYCIPSVAHLIALLVRRHPTFPPTGTNLIVIDNFSTLFDRAYPRHPHGKDAPLREDRRRSLICELAAEFSKLAAIQDVALLVTNHTITKFRASDEAELRPPFHQDEWKHAMRARVVLFQDWLLTASQVRDDTGASGRSRRPARFAMDQKNLENGQSSQNSDQANVVAFDVSDDGLVELPKAAAPPNVSPVKRRTGSNTKKRRFDDVAGSDHGEGDSSDGSNYGDWDADDLHELAAEGLVDDSCLSNR